LNDQLSQSQKAMNERLDAVSKRVGDSLNDQTERTGQTLKAPAERLAIIDKLKKTLLICPNRLLAFWIFYPINKCAEASVKYS
jgi:predicted secreted acid phosphatase